MGPLNQNLFGFRLTSLPVFSSLILLLLGELVSGSSGSSSDGNVVSKPQTENLLLKYNCDPEAGEPDLLLIVYTPPQ